VPGVTKLLQGDRTDYGLIPVAEEARDDGIRGSRQLRTRCTTSNLNPNTMTTPRPKNTMRGMVAGMLLLSGIVLGLLVGLGIGALVGATAVFLCVGLGLGFAAGMAAVIVRFRDL
jgi:F0F1-type ATP synthase assembly protein I